MSKLTPEERKRLEAELAQIRKAKAALAEESAPKKQIEDEYTPPPEESWSDYAKRKAIRTARAVGTGLADTPSALANLPSSLYNLGAAGVDYVAGTNVPKAPELPYVGTDYLKPAFDKATNYAYVPRSPAEKYTEKGIEAVAGLSPTKFIAQGVARAAKAANAARTARVADVLADTSRMNAANIGIAGGAGAGSAMGQDDGGTLGALVGGVAGGFAGSGARNFPRYAARNILNPARATENIRHPIKNAYRWLYTDETFPEKLASAKAQGIDPTLAAVGNERAKYHQAYFAQNPRNADKFLEHANKQRKQAFEGLGLAEPVVVDRAALTEDAGGLVRHLRDKYIGRIKSNYGKKMEGIYKGAEKKGISSIPKKDWDAFIKAEQELSLGTQPTKSQIEGFYKTPLGRVDQKLKESALEISARKNKDALLFAERQLAEQRLKDLRKEQKKLNNTPLLNQNIQEAKKQLSDIDARIDALSKSNPEIPFTSETKLYQSTHQDINRELEASRSRGLKQDEIPLARAEMELKKIFKEKLPAALRKRHEDIDFSYKTMKERVETPTQSWSKASNTTVFGDMFNKLNRGSLDVSEFVKDQSQAKNFLQKSFEYLATDKNDNTNIYNFARNYKRLSAEGKAQMNKIYALSNPKSPNKLAKVMNVLSEENEFTKYLNTSKTGVQSISKDDWNMIGDVLSGGVSIGKLQKSGAAIMNWVLQKKAAEKFSDPKFLEALRYGSKIENPRMLYIFTKKLENMGVSPKIIGPIQRKIENLYKNMGASSKIIGPIQRKIENLYKNSAPSRKKVAADIRFIIPKKDDNQ